MVNLLRMDLYRMWRIKAFLACLILVFVLALSGAPVNKLLWSFASTMGAITATEEESLELDPGKLNMALLVSGVDENQELSDIGPAKMAEILSEAGISGDISKADPDSELGVVLEQWGGDREALAAEMSRLSRNKRNEGFSSEQNLSAIISEPFPMLGLMLILISVCYFFYADVENGYIKNIAGQMPMKGFTVLSKFLAAIVHNLVFITAGILGNLIGTLIVQRIVVDSGILEGLRILALRFLLLNSICAIILLVVATFQNKSLGMILAVVIGLGMSKLVYLGIDTGLEKLFGKPMNVSQYMPDSVMGDNPPETVKAILVALVTSGVFLPLAIRIFDRKDVK